MRLLPLSFVVFLAGCPPEGVKLGDTGDIVGDDTAEEIDTDTDTDADTDTDTDTDTTDPTPGPSGTLTFLLSGETDADTLQLELVNEDFASLGEVVAADETAGGTVTLSLEGLADGDLYDVPDYDFRARYALPYLFVDADGDGEHDTDEVVRAATSTMALYLKGTIPIELAGMGFVEGWNAVEVTSDGLAGLYETDSVPLEVNLTPVETGAIGGTVGIDLDGTTPRLIVLPSTAFEGADPGPLLYNQGLDTTWSVGAAGAPDDAHITDLSGGGFYAAIEIPIAFDDQNGDGWPGDTEVLAPACSGTSVAALLWIAPPTDPLFAWQIGSAAFAPGWYPVRATDDGFEPLSEADANALVISNDCSF